MQKRFLLMMVSAALILSACGRECPMGVNYTDPSCAGYVGQGYNPYQYQNPYQQYPNGYYPPNYQYPQTYPPVYPQPYYQPTQVPPNPYQYPCDPRNPYCYR